MIKQASMRMNHNDPFIVVIDDDQRILDLFYDFFSDKYNIKITKAPQDVFEILRNNKITVAIVISDHHMNVMNGISLLTKVKEIDKTVKRILITGDRSQELVIDAINVGNIHGYFSKPLNFEYLISEIDNHYNDYLKYLRNEYQHKMDREEILKLREALKRKNSIFYTNTTVLNPETSEFDIFSILKNKKKQMLDLFDENLNQSREQKEKLLLLINEVTLITENSGLLKLKIYCNLLKFVQSVLQNEIDKFSSELDLIENQINKLSSSEFEKIISRILSRIQDKTINVTIKKYGEFQKFITKQLLEILQIPVDLLKSKESFVIQGSQTELMKRNLGYIIVVTAHVTVYTKEINPITDVSPTLIGNLAIGITEFSSELFKENSEIQILEQNKGILMVLRASKDLFYVAIAYDKGIYYYYLLNKIANKTKELFLNKIDNPMYENHEISLIDEKIDKILDSGIEISYS